MPLTYISENVSKWGYGAAQFRTSPNFYITLVHPDDVPHVRAWMTSLLQGISQPSWLTGYVLHLIGEVTIGETSRGSRAVVQTVFIRPPPVDSSLA